MNTEDFELDIPEIPAERAQTLNAVAGAKRFRFLQFSCQETLDHLKYVKENCSDIKDFWPTALLSHIVIEGVCNAKSDKHALSFVTDVELEQDPKDPRPFKLIFHFKENPYFSNTTLTKEFSLAEGSSSSNGDLTKAQQEFDFGKLVPSTTEINWKSDEVNLCKKYPRNKNVDPEDYEGDAGSFFYFFTEKAGSHSLGAVLQQDLLADVVEYFLGKGENCEVELSDEDELDEEDVEDDDDSIDLEEERSVKKRKM